MTAQFVTFRIDDYLLGIDVLTVREINRVLDITPVQHAPEYVRGLANLRGQTITVIDLGTRLGLGPRKIGEESHNIVLKLDAVGLLVDSVGDVVEIRVHDIEPPPANVGGIQKQFVGAVAQLQEELLAILSAEKILEYRPSQTGLRGQA